MSINRRTLIKGALSTSALLGATTLSHSPLAGQAKREAGSVAGGKTFKRITVEEFFITPELAFAQQKLLAQNPADEPGFTQFFGTTMKSLAAKGAEGNMERMMDIGELRLAAMDRDGIDMQLLSLMSPGVQVYDARQGSDLAQTVNEQLASAVQRHPDRFAGLATVAPQDPSGAAKELERAVTKLGMKGLMINSHTKGEFLDEEKYWVILEKAQQLDVPIYIHPRTPAPDMVKPFQKYFGLEAAAFGFNIDTSLHALRLILGGVFEEFPKLKIVLGHMGEGIPFWLPRIDHKMALFHSLQPPQRSLHKKPSEYFLENFYITTSGMNYEHPLMLSHRVVGPDRILFAVDYPAEEAEEPVRMMDAAPISTADKEKIYHLNAEKLFRLS
jgi:2,3-dihydroxybenzoate decarboxylase